MSGFGNKNAPWQQRGGPGLHHDIGMMNNTFGSGNMFQQGLPLQQQGLGLAGVAPGIATSQAISYPAPRALQASVGGAAFGPQQTSTVKGDMPRIHDRVLVEASYNPNMPFKWNASRIQVLPNQNRGGGGGGSGGGGGGGGAMHGGGFMPTNQPGAAFGGNDNYGNSGGRHDGPQGPSIRTRDSRFDGGGGGGGRNDRGNMGGGGPRGGGGDGRSDRGSNRQQRPSPPRRNRDNDKKDNRMMDRSTDRDRDSAPRASGRKRSRSPSHRRSRSPVRRSRSRSRSPPRRRARTAPRYNVQVAKICLDFTRSNVMELKKRYNNLYIPSDFFTAKHRWTEAFPIHLPFKMQYATNFHVFTKELVEPLSPPTSVFDPFDADHSWAAKVMLLASPNIEEMYDRTCQLAEADKDTRSLIHPTRAIQFLVGLKGKNETMAIGGPWSPSLDGPDPANDPSVLIKTAIRTCNALTGLDLSGCTQWTRFLQVHYRRQETASKPARTETVVIFFPDVWNVMPNKLEYDGITARYAEACSKKLEGKKVEGEDMMDNDGNEETKDEEMEDDETDSEVAKSEPKHWKELDPKTMKVNELREQLNARAISSKGLKSQLLARLIKALEKEQEKEEKGELDGEPMEKEGMDPEALLAKEDDPSNEEAKSDYEKEKVDDEKKAEKEVTVVLDEKQKEKISSAYKCPQEPCLMVHANNKAKSGKFDCRVESLSVLLDYRTEDNKEGTFEVSLFAELFNEMFMRDSAFKLYRAITNAAEKVKEEKKKEDKKEDEPTKKDDEEKREEGDKEDGKEKEDKKKEGSVEITEEKKEEPKKLVTVDKDLLLACSYFDLSHCGYFESKDVEDILLTLPLDLSRAEIKKMASKLVVGKDQVNYRQLTDFPEEENIEKEDKGKGESGLTAKELAPGFRQFIPGDKDEGDNGNTVAVTGGEGVVAFRGSVVDVGKLMEKLDKSETVRAATDLKLTELQKDLSQVKGENAKFSASKEKLNTDLREVRKKLREREDELKTSKLTENKYFEVLQQVHCKVAPLVVVPEKKEEEKIQEANGLKVDEELKE